MWFRVCRVFDGCAPLRGLRCGVGMCFVVRCVAYRGMVRYVVEPVGFLWVGVVPCDASWCHVMLLQGVVFRALNVCIRFDLMRFQRVGWICAFFRLSIQIVEYWWHRFLHVCSLASGHVCMARLHNLHVVARCLETRCRGHS